VLFPETMSLEEAIEMVWKKMSELRQSGHQQVEGDLHMEGEVLKAEVRVVVPKPVEAITLTLHVGDS